jgi:hypothetical protein
MVLAVLTDSLAIMVAAMGHGSSDVRSHDHQQRSTTMECPMKIQSAIAALVLGGMLASPLAFAENSQQSKMTVCNKQAGDKKGDERKAFMSSCLSASAPVAASTPMTQQQKMTECNKQATGKKGDERKAFMSSCLSNKG